VTRLGSSREGDQWETVLAVMVICRST